ncbi:hypothetical protein V6N13_067298 [Hibiscus sabdariffa]|uniref:COP1-interacting protein 7 n=1 Tax=Hibiscus sabdariffa TaxID=183260 RepID=A0ABR2DW93_9ROSI
MDGGDAILDYATIQILPSQNRYEAYTCRGNNVEKLSVGVLQKLLPHLPELNNLCTHGSVSNSNSNAANYKLQPPSNLKSPAWFTLPTFSRFLDIVGSTDLLDTAKVIEAEMSQLEEAKRFHLSLYARGHQDHNQSNENGKSQQFEVQNSLSETSKNELLRAMDSRLASLRSKLIVAFNQTVGETCSYEEITHLAKFSENFGASDVKKFLCMFLELREKCEIANPLSDENSSCTHASVNGSINKTDGNDKIPKPVSSDTPVKYGVSPAKAAQVERQSSTESEESSDSSDEIPIPADRSRALIRSASPRRSASPMRRVQIGRTGSRRAPALTVKSLGCFPAREKISFQRDVASDDNEEEGSGHIKKPENNVLRMSVQDAISLFESKQRDQIADVPKRNSLANVSLGPSKSSLRRWSASMCESAVQSQSQNGSEDPPVSEPSNNVIDNDIMERSTEVNLESDTRTGAENIKEAVDVRLKRLEESSCSPIDIQEVTDITHEEETNETSKSTVEWSRQKEVELDQMCEKMMENLLVSRKKPQTEVRQTLPPEQRGGFYHHYKEKRDQKLRGENVGKHAEKEAKLKAMLKNLDERKARMASTNVNSIRKIDPPTKSQITVKNSQKLLKNPSQPANTRKETKKLSAEKKVSARTSPLPATRKSWPSTPSPRTAGASPAKTPGACSSSGTTSTRRKPQSAQAVAQPSPKVENSLPHRRNPKATQTEKQGLVGVNEKQQQKMMKSSRTTITKIAVAPGDSSGMYLAKPSLYNKVKKSSVVPLDSRPSLRKGSGFMPSGRVNKTKSPSQLEDSLKNTENSIDPQESDVVANASVLVSEHQEQGVSSLDHCDDATQSETQLNGHQKGDVVESVNKLAPGLDAGFKIIVGSSQCEEESTISPTAWVEIEEHQNLPNICDEKTAENTSSAGIAPVVSTSPRVRHSLSRMLQEESSGCYITEWGNAESLPAMVYQKDAPKGLKKLLKFARKNKGDANITGWSSPSVFSEGEDDTEESKAINKRNSDNLLRKAALNIKNHGQEKTVLSDGFDRNLSSHELQSAQSGIRTFDALKLQHGSVSATASSTKAVKDHLYVVGVVM